MELVKLDDLIFYISVDQIQAESIYHLGRKLTKNEIYTVSKGIEAGLNFDIETVYKTCFHDISNK